MVSIISTCTYAAAPYQRRCGEISVVKPTSTTAIAHESAAGNILILPLTFQVALADHKPEWKHSGELS
jgi:hypothetical protein